MYLNMNNFIYKYQFGFKKGCGTEEAVVNVINFICKSLDEGSTGVGGLFLDFSKAFDLVDHTILLEKLMFYGVCGKEWLLFKSYLTNRKQFVQIGEAKSNLTGVVSGVPQGSCLGPLLFSIYINDLSNLGLIGSLYMFADDICLFYPYKYEQVLKTNMEKDMSLIFEFARINKLILNADKTKLIRFRPNSHKFENEFSVYVDGKVVTEDSKVKYLGVTLQKNLCWDAHIDNLKSKVAPAIGILHKMKYILDIKSKMLIYQSLIESHLKYLVIIYGWKYTSKLKSLQCMQNKALKTVYNLPHRYSTISLYTDICDSVLPIHALYVYQLMMYVYKSRNNIGYHTICFRQNQSVFNTRNCQNVRIVLCRLEITKQRIEYIGAVEFNNLPLDVRNTFRISIFKKHLKEYLKNNILMLLNH